MQRINWDNVKCFIATARAGSLTAAAAQLNISPATLSRRLASLEFGLGQLLFARTPAGYQLTDEGARLLRLCAPIETSFESLADSFDTPGQGPSGIVRLAISENIANLIVMPRMMAFQKRYPLIQLDMQTGVRTIPLHDREADLALRVSMPESGAFRARRVGVLHHALYGERSRDGNDGATHEPGLIGWTQAHSALPIAKAAITHPLWRTPSLRISSLQSLVAAAQAGLGYAYLPCLVGDHAPGLTRIAGPQGYLRQNIYLILHDDTIETPRIRAVADFLIDCMHDAADLLAGR